MEKQTNEGKDKFKSKDFLITVVVMAIFIIGISIGPISEHLSNSTIDSDSFPASQPMTPAWYEGGTLHQATMLEWKNASYSNQLATMADAIGVYIGKEKTALFLTKDPANFRLMAETMVKCINDFSSNIMLDSDTVGAYIFICLENYKVKEAADRAIAQSY